MRKRARVPWPTLRRQASRNPLLLLILSMVVGALFGWASGKLAGALTKEA